MEIEKNWNKFTFKKLGIIFCLFLFGVVTFISGNLAQVNAASSSTVLPVAKGGTGSNSASGARTNLNVQETLVSGTNIKSVFGQSLLGSGNLNSIAINTQNVLPGQIAFSSSGNSGDSTINQGIVISYLKSNIVFTKTHNQICFFKITTPTGVTSVVSIPSEFNDRTDKTITVSVPKNNFIEGFLQSKVGSFTIMGVNDFNYGFQSYLTRKG
jgi:hypothetical protein